MLLVLSFADGFPGWLVRMIRKDKSSFGRTGTLSLLMLRASVLLMYSCVWGWIGCGEFLLVSLMGDILGGWWGVYSSTCQCWITQTRWLPLQLLQDKPRSLEGWSVKSPVISIWPQAASMEDKKAQSFTLRGTPQYLFIYVFIEVFHSLCWSCHNLINQHGVLQWVTDRLLIGAILLSMVSTGLRLCHAFAFTLRSLRMLFVEVW